MGAKGSSLSSRANSSGNRERVSENVSSRTSGGERRRPRSSEYVVNTKNSASNCRSNGSSSSVYCGANVAALGASASTTDRGRKRRPVSLRQKVGLDKLRLPRSTRRSQRPSSTPRSTLPGGAPTNGRGHIHEKGPRVSRWLNVRRRRKSAEAEHWRHGLSMDDGGAPVAEVVERPDNMDNPRVDYTMTRKISDGARASFRIRRQPSTYGELHKLVKAKKLGFDKRKGLVGEWGIHFEVIHPTVGYCLHSRKNFTLWAKRDSFVSIVAPADLIKVFPAGRRASPVRLIARNQAPVSQASHTRAANAFPCNGMWSVDGLRL